MLLLRRSRIHGIGVFTAVALPRDRVLELFAPGDWRFVTHPHRAELRLCERFGIPEDDGFHCPREWIRMSIGWYLNHSDRPNLVHEDYVFRTARPIAAGRELTIDYRAL